MEQKQTEKPQATLNNSKRGRGRPRGSGRGGSNARLRASQPQRKHRNARMSTRGHLRSMMGGNDALQQLARENESPPDGTSLVVLQRQLELYGIGMHVAGSRNALIALDVRAHEDIEQHPSEIVLQLSHEDVQQSSAEIVEQPQSSAEIVEQPPSEDVKQPIS